MQEDKHKEKYLKLFNKLTDACTIMEQACDTCVIMEVVPEYDPASEDEAPDKAGK